MDTPVNYNLQWDGTKPYYDLNSGGKQYLSPAEAMGIQQAAKADGTPVDPRVTAYLGGASPETGGTSGPTSSLFKNAGEWNPDTGKFDQSINWGNIMAMGVGGAMAAPLIAGAVAGGAAGGGSAAAGGGAATGGGVVGGGLGTGALGVGATVPGAGMATGVGMGSTGGSLLSGIGTSLVKGGVSKALSGYAQSAAGNREAANNDNLKMAQAMLERDAQSRRDTSSAYRDSMMSQYAQNYHPNVRPNGVPGGSPNPVTPASQAASGELYAQALAKLKANAGNYTTPVAQIPSMQTKPGVGENLAGYGSLLLSLMGK